MLKSITNGLARIQEIYSFLGIEIYQIEKVLSELISRDLVKKLDKIEKLCACQY
ncbi:hypothetical protein [Okeania sp.]|uniref:hypothetical protein n=1 Tax=Okeania sp. TaxID=3100323 RepID=UPI002B4B83D0|nr:hypothetical protein [Okeania sp.]MEB3343399.1 hypothetical protein [Okeania sp.]